MDRFLAQRMDPLLLSIVPVGEKVVHLDRCDFSACLLQCAAQPFDDLGLARCRRPGDGQQDRRSLGRDQLLDTLYKRLIRLGVRFLELLVANVLVPLEPLLLLLKAPERPAAQVRHHRVGEIGRPVQKVETPYVEIRSAS